MYDLFVSFLLQNENIRMSLYVHLDWHEFDLETRKLVHFLIVGCTPEATIKIGDIFALNMESFTTVRRKGRCRMDLLIRH